MATLGIQFKLTINNMKKIIYVLAISLASSGLSHAVTTSFTFSSPFGPAAVAANNAGAATSGLYWGIVVDTAGNGLSSTYEGEFIFTADGVASPLNNTDDTLFIALTQTVTSPFLPSDGLMDSMPSIEVGSTVGNAFSLIWFDATVTSPGTVSSGTHYGIFTDASMIIEAGAPASYENLFDSSPMAASQTFASVPEPSSTALLGLGSVALLLRRRR